jgi:hypothetical protein
MSMMLSLGQATAHTDSSGVVTYTYGPNAPEDSSSLLMSDSVDNSFGQLVRTGAYPLLDAAYQSMLSAAGSISLTVEQWMALYAKTPSAAQYALRYSPPASRCKNCTGAIDWNPSINIGSFMANAAVSFGQQNVSTMPAVSNSGDASVAADSTACKMSILPSMKICDSVLLIAAAALVAVLVFKR